GESGEGNFLFAQARKQAPDDAAYHQALELFVAEEQTHARLLEQLVHYFGGGTIKRHWTHALFRLARRAFGLNFELQVLVIAELESRKSGNSADFFQGLIIGTIAGELVAGRRLISAGRAGWGPAFAI